MDKTPTACATGLPKSCRTALARYLRPAFFKALCDEQRLTLLARLAMATNPLTVSEAADCCGVHISGVSRHLSILRQAGIVHAEKRGREVAYQLDTAAIVTALRGLADALETCRNHFCAPQQENDHEPEPNP